MTNFADSQLLDDETIEKQYISEGWNWLLTNKRIIRYKEEKIGQNMFEDLDYKHIVSVRLLETNNLWLLSLGLLFLLIGFVLVLSNDRGMFLVGTGVILIIIFAFVKIRSCEIIAPNVKWITTGNPTELTRDIRRHM